MVLCGTKVIKSLQVTSYDRRINIEMMQHHFEAVVDGVSSGRSLVTIICLLQADIKRRRFCLSVYKNQKPRYLLVLLHSFTYSHTHCFDP